MRNKYRIENGIVFIEILYRNNMYEARFNEKHLTKILKYDVKWGISFNASGGQMYVMAQINGKTTYLHRIVTDAPKGMVVDHISHDALDNTDSNLNVVTYVENQHNQLKASINSKSGVLGVSWDKVNQKWRATIMVKKRAIGLGRYFNIDDAIKARRNAEKIYFPYLSKISVEAV